VRFRLATDPDRLDSDLDALFALHAARWRGKRSPFAAAEAFHRDFARLAHERGRLRLWFLELDGRPAAALYGFRFGAKESFFQSGRDPAVRDGSPGFVLLAHGVEEALSAGARECNFLRGDDPYKLRLASEERTLETVALARGPLGHAALAAARRAAPLPFSVRSALARIAAR